MTSSAKLCVLITLVVLFVAVQECECTYDGTGGEAPGGTCFPGVSAVMLDDGSETTMDTLQPGQTVMTVSDNGALVPTKVLTFLHKVEYKVARFLRLLTESGHQLKLTATHQLYATSGNNTNSAQMKMAADVHVGDYVFVSHQGRVEPSVIVDITDSQLTGVYNPLTEHGTLLVDGVLTSCYASFEHDLAHVAMTPLRWFPQLFEVLPITEDRQHSYAKLMKWLGRTVLSDTFFRKCRAVLRNLRLALTASGKFMHSALPTSRSTNAIVVVLLGRVQQMIAFTTFKH